MIESMTGFGRGSHQQGGISVSVELRSVNSRHCEVAVRLPETVSSLESEIQTFVRSRFQRGKIHVRIQIAYTDERAMPVRANMEAARAYGKLLESIREACGLTEPVRMENLLHFSEIITSAEADDTLAAENWLVIRPALTEAVDSLQQMRRKEGDILSRDMQQRINHIHNELQTVKERAPERVIEGRRKINERIAQLLGDTRFDAERLELEIAIFADKLDITEECVRLDSHLDQFVETLELPESAGRRLNFLVQEINREINTIGAKANDTLISHSAVTMKEELEKIREQVQNVE